MITNSLVRIHWVGTADCLWRYEVAATGQTYDISPPVFEIDGSERIAVIAALEEMREPAVRRAGNVTEYVYAGSFTDDPELALRITLQIPDDSPVVRFRYTLTSARECRLTKTAGKDSLTYLETSFAHLPAAWEVRLSEFSELVHSFCLAELPVNDRHFDNSLTVMGPLLVGASDTHALLLAYEHGSQVPDAFLQYHLSPTRAATLCAVKGSYCDRQIVDSATPYRTLWMEIAAVPGDVDTLARAYRSFVLKHLSPNRQSRAPYIFYNTWNFQERNRWWYHQQYLDSMNEERMLQEIEAAHRMGIDVFVLDTGWYEKTGDWRTSSARFPRGLAPIKEKLDEYDMKLGLWFNPTVAAVSSQMRRRHEDCLMTRNGKPGHPHEVWETEASQGLCLVSRYGDAFADELIRLVREVGVTYFKWDAIGQYGCDAPGHGHGTEENTPEERRNSYAFQLGAAMARVVDKVCAACPEAIVDFDITEGGRTVGLQFLAAGKYFLINNGPYSQNYDLPKPADGNVNLFFFPGPARAWICRTPLTYDKWIPSVLFLTHYLPDDTHREGWNRDQEVNAENQWITIASLVLGQNGIWGDLLRVSDEGIARFGTALGLYKQVRDDITESYPVRTGAVGGSPEVHEKISEETGRGVVSVFASAPGRYTYVTQNAVAPGIWHNNGVTVTTDARGRACLDLAFDKAGAKVIFFGITA